MTTQDKAITLSGDTEIAYFRLAQLKGALKLEGAGMKGRQSPLRPKIADEFGLKPRAKHSEFIAVIQAKMDQMIADKAAKATE